MQAAEIIAAEYGKTFTWEMQTQIMGLAATEDAKYNIETNQLPLTVDEYLTKVNSVCNQLFPNAEKLPGTPLLLGIICAVLRIVVLWLYRLLFVEPACLLVGKVQQLFWKEISGLMISDIYNKCYKVFLN